MERMKKTLLAAAVIGALLVGAALVAGAGAAKATLSKDKTAALTGTSVWGMSSMTFPIEGAFAGKLGDGTYAGTLTAEEPWNWDFPECGPSCARVSGTITFSTKHGSFTAALQPGSVVVASDIASHSWRTFLSTGTSQMNPLELEVISGSRSYAHADGLLTLSYVSTWSHYYDSDKGVLVNEIVDTGTLSGRIR